MYPSEGLQTALNKMREMSVESNSIFHQFVPYVTDSTTIGEYGAPILDTQNLNVMNDFVSLLKKVVYTAVYNKTFNNPLAQLEGERMPLGNFIESVYVNPARARSFNVNDFAGLLEKYSAEVATEYYEVNQDSQYSVTLTRDKIRNAFTSWNNLESFISGYINSLYNGAYLRRYTTTKALVTAAFTGNKVQYQTISNPVDKQTAQAMIQQLRATFSKFQVPSTKYNAWEKVKGDRMALKTWSNPEDIVVMISADVEALVDVQVLAAALNANADKTDFLGRVIVVDDFNIYDDEGNVAVDGSHIKAAIMDKAWFKIKTQDFTMDEFFNPSNRTWQYFLNDVRMVNYSLFANAVVFATSAPTVDATDLDIDTASVTVTAGQTVKVPFDITPANATSTISVTSSASTYATGSVVGRDIVVEGKAEGSATLTVAANGHSDTIAVTVQAAA